MKRKEPFSELGYESSPKELLAIKLENPKNHNPNKILKITNKDRETNPFPRHSSLPSHSQFSVKTKQINQDMKTQTKKT